MQSAIFHRVDELIRSVAAELVLPAFRAETPEGEAVPHVDAAVEAKLSKVLQAILPGSRVVGEEQTGSSPVRWSELGRGDVWLVDPLDGTSNFVAGVPRFAIMVALLREGETVASWIYDPVEGVMATAEKAAGAFLGGRRVNTLETSPGIAGLRGIILPRFLPDEIRQQVLERSVHLAEVLSGSGSAGHDYPALVRGSEHFALHWCSFPWDHAPGALFLSEAGGHVARLDGTAYRVWDGRSGLLAAGNRTLWGDAQRALFTDSAAVELASTRRSWSSFRLQRP